MTDRNTRQGIRRNMRQARRALTAHAHHQASVQAVQRLSCLQIFRNAKRIACYFPNDGEIDAALLIEHIHNSGKQCYMPVLDTLSGNKMWFAPYSANSATRPNRYGIAEPCISARHYLRAQQLDLLITPLVAFDAQGNRLGMGGGYYDRTLAYLRHHKAWIKPSVIGIAFECQRIDQLPAEDWDIPLHAIVTEKCLYHP